MQRRIRVASWALALMRWQFLPYCHPERFFYVRIGGSSTAHKNSKFIESGAFLIW